MEIVIRPTGTFRTIENIGTVGTTGTIGAFRFLFGKPAELVSFNYGAVDGVKFAAVVEVFVHD